MDVEILGPRPALISDSTDRKSIKSWSWDKKKVSKKGRKKYGIRPGSNRGPVWGPGCLLAKRVFWRIQTHGGPEFPIFINDKHANFRPSQLSIQMR